MFFQQVDFSKFFFQTIKTCETLLEVGAQAASNVLSTNNDVKTDSEVLSHLTATLLSSDMKGTELGSYDNIDFSFDIIQDSGFYRMNSFQSETSSSLSQQQRCSS